MIFNQSGEFQKYFKNTLALFFEKILRLVVGFFVIFLLTIYLGPEKFGLLSYAQTYISIAVSLAALGIDSIVTREIVKSPKEKDAILGTALCINILSSSIVILLVILLVSLSEDLEVAIIISILSFSILFSTFGFLVDSYFQAKVLSKYIFYHQYLSLL